MTPDPTQMDLTALQVREHELAAQVPGLLHALEESDKVNARDRALCSDWYHRAMEAEHLASSLSVCLADAEEALARLRAWVKEVRDLAVSGKLVAPAAVMARILTDGLGGDL